MSRFKSGALHFLIFFVCYFPMIFIADNYMRPFSAGHIMLFGWASLEMSYLIADKVRNLLTNDDEETV